MTMLPWNTFICMLVAACIITMAETVSIKEEIMDREEILDRGGNSCFSTCVRFVVQLGQSGQCYSQCETNCWFGATVLVALRSVQRCRRVPLLLLGWY